VGAKFAEVRQSESVNNIAGKASGLGSSLLVSIQVMQFVFWDRQTAVDSLKKCEILSCDTFVFYVYLDKRG